MTALDNITLVAYIAVLIAMGAFLGKRIKSSTDMFAAGRQSPWWVAGLSAFMSMWSAGSFVVWGSVAYRLGLVAVTVGVSLGLGGLVIGRFVAGRWRRLGVTTAAEFLDLRFGHGVLQLYTYLNLAIRMFGLGVALYAIGVMVSGLMTLPPGNFLADSDTGHLSVEWAIILGGGLVLTYTVAGGLWAVLMTDVLQFIVVSLIVLIVLPLVLIEAGGPGQFIANAPDGFFYPAAAQYTLIVLVIYGVINCFRIGAEWPYVQRYLSVPTERDARKAAYLFGVLYLTVPFFLYLPPMIWRVVDPGMANPEQAYILACQAVLPAGMLGLTLAAMFSATASMVDSDLNVFAGVLTRDFYRQWINPDATEAHLKRVGRIFTVLLGLIVILVALAVPHIGGAEKIVLAITGLFAGPMVLIPIWGLFSTRVGARSIWTALGLGFGAGFLLKFGFTEDGWLSGVDGLQGLITWITPNILLVEVCVGLGTPLLTLLCFELLGKEKDSGSIRLGEHVQSLSESHKTSSSTLPVQLVAWTLGLLACLMLVVAFRSPESKGVIFTFTVLLLGSSVAFFLFAKRALNRLNS